ncbi:hypothetical protein HanXRQr2_Chr09g0384231 [Helianthus annuus]|uniref:Uncharacterized protein n=1 Tax=Helianthus annuus TaxID=4232 RepID=A0A9K3N825_HELAN|nr:hypothetical protein HanXRQr2_Chr09g0384231 [Helianthus annuus]
MQGKLCEYNGFFLSGKFLSQSSSTAVISVSSDADFDKIKVLLFVLNDVEKLEDGNEIGENEERCKFVVLNRVVEEIEESVKVSIFMELN